MKNYIDINKDFDFKNIQWDFKILFLVPLKALANEIVNKFNNQLKFLNIVINEFSGDVNLSREQIEKKQIYLLEFLKNGIYLQGNMMNYLSV